ncbi:MAG: helix-turn-helix domain-containing protein [Pseudomonadota bacterium]|nr:helix-turn-helix domain-containing protein [Pseudomonadota bacterium]
MHKLNILIFGPKSFISTINELKDYLKFNFTEFIKETSIDNFDGIIYHEEILKDKINKTVSDNKDCFKILASYDKKNDKSDLFDFFLKLPTSINEINNVVESLVAKKKFVKNSSIKIKSYTLNKNDKKLLKKNQFIILTEKEINLMELFLNKKKPMSKNEILSLVWNYSSDADTHTVETHIYRLRKKISDKFSDDNFILNNKKGYYF